MEKLKDLINKKFAKEILGIGTCGIKFDQNGNFIGYLYATSGEGNMENYLTVEELLEQYGEDMGEIYVKVEFNSNGEINYLHG